MIFGFKDKVKLFTENPEIKLGDPMLLDSCVWYIESTLNYNYSDVENEVDTMYFAYTYIDIDLINGRVELSEAISAFNKFEDTLSLQNGEISESNEHFVLADISIESSTSQEATLCMLSVFIAGGPINIMSFNSTYDYWRYGIASSNSGGYCGGPNNGTHTWDDAAEQIERKVRYRAAVPSGRYYSINNITLMVRYDLVYNEETGTSYPSCDLSNPDDETSNDNDLDYLIYRSTSQYSNHHACLIPDEMNFYLDGMEDIIYTNLYDCVADIEDLDFVSINMQADLYSQTYTVYLHKGYITYGELIFTSTSPQQFE